MTVPCQHPSLNRPAAQEARYWEESWEWVGMSCSYARRDDSTPAVLPIEGPMCLDLLMGRSSQPMVRWILPVVWRAGFQQQQ